MKRIHWLYLICAALFFLSLVGSRQMRSFCSGLKTGLDGAAALLEQQQTDPAADVLQQCRTWMRRRRAMLDLFVRREGLINLETSLAAAQSYAADGDVAEADAEVARAKAQTEAILQLFFRIL